MNTFVTVTLTLTLTITLALTLALTFTLTAAVTVTVLNSVSIFRICLVTIKDVTAQTKLFVVTCV